MRPIGLLTGIGVARVVGSWVALRPKVFLYNWLLGTPLGGTQPAPRMRAVLFRPKEAFGCCPGSSEDAMGAARARVPADAYSVLLERINSLL